MVLTRNEKRRAWATLRRSGPIAVFLLAALCLFPQGALALSDADELGSFGSEGTGAGQFIRPGSSDADPDTGHLYVASLIGNNRVDEFTPWGDFVKAFGWDVAPGSVDEQQEVRLRAGAGTFVLDFEGDQTDDLPFHATGEEVKAALEALATIGGAGGEVSVAGSPGNPATASPYVYVIAFKGSLAGTNVPQLTVTDGATPLSGGEPETSLEARTRANGTPGGTGLESCTAESGCQEGSVGTGAGQIFRGASIALDDAGDVYLVDGVGNLADPSRLQKFTATGEFLWMLGGEVNKTTGENLCTAASGNECGTPVAGSGPGEFQTGSNFPVVAVDKTSGEILVASGKRIQRFDAAGAYLSEIEVPDGISRNSLAIDPADGDLYVGFFEQNNIRKLDPLTGEETDSLAVETSSLGLAAGIDGSLFATVSRTDSGNNRGRKEAEEAGRDLRARVIEFDAEGERVSVFAELPSKELSLGGIGANALGNLYVANSSDNLGAFVRFFGPPPVSFEAPPLVAPEIAAQYAVSAGTSEAELRAQIDPRFWTDTSYHLEWGTGPCSEGGCAETEEVTLTDKVTGSPTTTQGVFLEGLDPGTTYHYRFVTQSSGGGPTIGPDKSFTTFRAPEAQSCPANEAFRSGPSAALPDCRAYELVSPLDKEGGDIVVMLDTSNLLPAVLSQSAASGERIAYGSYRSFGGADSAPYTSQYIAARRPGVGWESHPISPPRERSFLVTVGNFDNEFRRFSADLCKATVQSFADPPLSAAAPEGYSNLYRRLDEECGGLSYEPFNLVEPPNIAPGGVETSFTLELQGVSEDEGTAVFLANDTLTPQGSKGANQLYGSRGGQEALICVLPGGFAHAGSCTGGGSAASIVGAHDRKANVTGALSADGERVFWTATVTRGEGQIYLREHPFEDPSAQEHGSATGTGKLTEGSNQVTALIAAQGKADFTEGSSEATLAETTVGRFVAGQPLAAGKTLPAGTTIVSVEGSTLNLSAPATETIAGKNVASLGPLPFAVGQTIAAPGIPFGTTITAAETGKLTLSNPASVTQSGTALEAFSACTEPEKACTVPVSGEAETQAGSKDGSLFQAAAADGSRVLFTTGGRLYEYLPDSDETNLIAAEVVGGILGAGEDAARSYFVSREARGGENAEGKEAKPGDANLYFHEGGEYRFIGALEGQDLDVLRHSPIALQPRHHTARVSADGLTAAFTSQASLTGYDSRGVSGGGASLPEVFIYDADGNGGAGELLCASCNPSGARPRGARAAEGGVNGIFSAARLPVFQNVLYGSRLLSADGRRLFFLANDALTPTDTNEREDVYQWQAAGKGGCTTASSSYSPRNEGCVDLISSGQGALDARFLDASASGGDVFFTTPSSLVPQDYGLVDVYDARIGGGLPTPPPPEPECEGESCQSPPPAPEPGVPASLGYAGPGNLVEQAVRAACAATARTAKQLAGRAKRLRRAARRAKGSAARRKRLRASRRAAKQAVRLSRNAKRCRARVRAARRPQR